MRLTKVILENFRSFKDRITVDIDDLTAFIGENDIGKSTILEALEIFFNNDTVKMGQDDLCVHASSNKITIGCIFSGFPSEPITIDASAKTTLQQEFLLNSNSLLEIHKEYDCSKKSVPHEIYLVSNYPSVQGASDLLELNQSQLKKRIKELGLDESAIDLRSKVSMRQAIYKSFPELKLMPKLIPAKGEVMSIWEKLKLLLPIYSLFQSDRPSLDGDSEVQDPMKLAIREALLSVEEQLAQIKDVVHKKAIEVANKTVEKLKEMDENLANQLNPHFSEEPKWDKIFKLSLDGDNHIPINKRGSGVRRLILLNFFRAEAERKVSESQSGNVIYAIEEPETSQHPNNQRLLAEALKTLAKNSNIQTILTTHVPGFAGMLPTDSLRYIKETSTGKQIKNARENEEILKEIAEDLGVLPTLIDNNVKVAVIVEGIHDVNAIKTFSKIMSEHDNTIVNISDNKNVIVVPSGGNTLSQWVENRYLKSLNIPEVHIYDSDYQTPPKYQKYCNKVNARGDGSVAFSTRKREMENYIHPAAIKKVFGIDIEIKDDTDVPEEICLKKPKEKKVKRKLNNEAVKAMTYEQLCEMDTYNEIKTWLKKISEFCLNPYSK